VASKVRVKFAIVIGVSGGRGEGAVGEGGRGCRRESSVSISMRKGDDAGRAATAPVGHQARCSSYVAVRTCHKSINN
jgi:hypothetical protein